MKETKPQAFERGIVLYSGREGVSLGPDLFAMPLSVWGSIFIRLTRAGL